MIVQVDGSDHKISKFRGDGDREIVQIADAFYTVHLLDDNTGYFMVKVGNVPRSFRGPLDRVYCALVRVHKTYRTYEDQCRRAKEAARRERDRRLHEIAEAL